MGCRAFAIEICGSYTRIGILGTIAECGGQRGAATLVVVCVLAIVDGAVNRNGPHGGSVAIAIAIILFATIPRCPDIDVAQSIASLQVGKAI